MEIFLKFFVRVTSLEKIIVLVSSFSWLNTELKLAYKSYAGGYYYYCYYDYYFLSSTSNEPLSVALTTFS